MINGYCSLELHDLNLGYFSSGRLSRRRFVDAATIAAI